MTLPAIDESDPVAWVNRAGQGTLADRMGIVFLEAGPEKVVATMPVDGNTQLFGMLHGGASAVLAESLGSLGAGLHAGPGRIAVGVDLNATHHRAARRGTVTGVATPVYLGRTTATYHIVITGDDGHRLCTARITCAIQDRRRRDRQQAQA